MDMKEHLLAHRGADKASQSPVMAVQPGVQPILCHCSACLLFTVLFLHVNSLCLVVCHLWLDQKTLHDFCGPPFVAQAFMLRISCAVSARTKIVVLSLIVSIPVAHD